MANCKNSDDSLTNIQNLKEINFLTFKGGGGKGIAYLGPLDVLSHENVGLLPLKLPISETNQIPGQGQGIIGISGTSAGAITAYLVALGLSPEQIRNESGLIPPKKNPNYDPNYNATTPTENGPTSENEDSASQPSSEEFLPGENSSGFNFEYFLTKDKPENGYKRAIIFDKASGRNKIVRCVDAVTEKLGKSGKNNQKVKDESLERAIGMGLNPKLSARVSNSHTKQELKKFRKSKVYPCQYIGKKGDPELKKSVEELIKVRKTSLLWASNIMSNVIDREAMSKSRSAIARTIFKDIETRNQYIYNLLYDKGLFPGFAIQEFFVDVTFRRLPVALGWNEQMKKVNRFDTPLGAEEMTFREFFDWTGLDLVIAGLNVVNGNQRNFSVNCTPDFPVVAAVMMSMNIPGLFKPVYVDAELNLKLNESERAKLKDEFRGYYVDAGLANNFPFHAFDERAKTAGRLNSNQVNELILGLAVQEGPDPDIFKSYLNKKKAGASNVIGDPFFQTYKEHDGEKLYENYTNRLMSDKNDPDFPSENFWHLFGRMNREGLNTNFGEKFNYNGIPAITGGFFETTLFPMLGWILNTVLINTTVSQTREEGAHARVVEIYAYHIGITDFKADESLTEFVIRRAREKTIRDLNLKLDPIKDFN